MIKGKLWYKTDKELFCERLRVVPVSKVPQALGWTHIMVGHTGSHRTILSFFQNFYTPLTKKRLLEIATGMFSKCEMCLLCKPKTQNDRGLIASIPIPQVANSLLYSDFISMDTIVCGLTRFCQFIPCQKSITSEKVFKLTVKHWISAYGKTTTIISDNDVRLTQDKCFYRNAFDAMDI